MTATATLSSKFQICIPKAIREGQQWQAGQRFVFIPKGKGMLLTPVHSFAALAGLAQGASSEACRDRQERV
jgi:AbrB family looped-hinge helix DNA binding protein